MDIGESLTNNNRAAKSHKQYSYLENHGGLYVTSVFIKQLIGRLKKQDCCFKKFTEISNKVLKELSVHGRQLKEI